ncbi:threonine synthase [Trichlorobacter ammonificans]|uniref:Threonine synthase n=1 Tax=Trichlorobacter ammonificans TaxID=2916410 RepID=A0ABM9DA94_9BACT|nr:threonine synthase [Trichlorobacter ammonificans]CAH2031318.1 Threonine synthase [Trichlorobacter ammonificans]
MRYLSTRGGITPIPFKDAVMMGLADDGGLLLPETIPTFTPEELESWRGSSYQDVAFAIISRFVDDIPAHDLRQLIERSYATFSHPGVTPVVKKDGVHILELFHGVTLAFKDVALQFLGNLFEYILAERNETMTILGATSGDTGSAAIHGVRGKKGITIFILHPEGKTSPVQALQMTSVLDANVHNIAVSGTFDDCQDMVKSLMGDLEFKKNYSLGAVNSINWARVLAQVVYYVYAWLKVAAPGQKVIFSVPTGNFGDIFAGYVAWQMGLPVEKLLLATNENNILTRCITSGDYSVGSVVQTLSPSMDIQVASNFERYLFYLFDRNPARVKEAFAQLKAEGRITFNSGETARMQQKFCSASVDREQTLQTIGNFLAETGYLLDPHTAVGVRAARELAAGDTPLICLSTAHPAKFDEAVIAATGKPVPVPESIAKLQGLPTRCDRLPADQQALREYIVRTMTAS